MQENQLAITSPKLDEATKDLDRPDVRVEMKVKNNLLWKAIYDCYPSAAAFCRAHKALNGKLSQICDLIGFRESPFRKGGPRRKISYPNGEYRDLCLHIALALNVSVEELFPAELYAKFVGTETKKVIEINSFGALSFAERKSIAHLTDQSNPDEERDFEELKEQIKKVLDILDPREREIIELRFGFRDGQEYTLDEVGRYLGLQKERVRQLQCRALNKLRIDNPSCIEKLEPFI